MYLALLAGRGRVRNTTIVYVYTSLPNQSSATLSHILALFSAIIDPSTLEYAGVSFDTQRLADAGGLWLRYPAYQDACTRAGSPAPEGQDDIVDEILTLFRVNVLFTNFEIKGNADRVLIYGTLFVHLCLKKLDRCTNKADATRILQQTAVDTFAIPGDSSFPLGGLVRAPSSANEAETIRGFFKQLREAIAFRLVDEVFPNGEKSKWWMFFAKRKFMNKELSR